MQKISGLIAVCVLGYAVMASADEPQPLTCEKPEGMIDAPLVPTSDVAREIYLAVAKGWLDKVRPTNVIKVDDDHGHWSVFQYPANLAPGEVVVGGGTLVIEIDKCNGMMHAYYAR